MTDASQFVPESLITSAGFSNRGVLLAGNLMREL